MEEQTRDLKDYINILRKYKTSMLIIMIAVIGISAMVAVLMPPTYRSSATILIERQSIPTELVQSTVTSYASERIQTIQAKVMSRTNLLEIIKKFDLYQDRLKFETSEEIVERMRGDVSLKVISADVVDPSTGRPSQATIAFSLSYEGSNPKQVQRVANELTTLYLEENLKSRTQKAEDTSTFLRHEAERLDKLISELGEKLADFKQKNAEALPELHSVNLQSLQRLESEINAVEAKIQNLDERRFYLEGQLAQTKPENLGINSPSSRLKLLESEYLSIRSKYSDDHPDVMKLKKEIESLKDEIGLDSSVSSKLLAEELSKLRAEYANAVQTYELDHPDVLDLQNRIAKLEEDLEHNPEKVEKTYYQKNPENPAYITLSSQLDAVNSEIKSTRQLKQRLKEKIAELETLIIKAPDVEKQYLSLLRDYENAVSQYKQTKAKLMHAETAKQLESESKGEKFTLIDPPAMPEQPISPNRPAILFLGFILSIGGGIGYAVVADQLAGVVRGAKNIQNVLGVAPLSVIPYQWNELAIRKRSQARKRFVLAGIASLAILFLLIHFVVSPLDVLWFRAIRKFSGFF